MGPLVIAIVIIIIACFCFIINYNTKIENKIKDMMKEKNASLYLELAHLNGLPVAEYVMTQIFSCTNEYEFIANNNNFKLNKEKVTDIAVTSHTEVEKQYVSSVGRAVGGAILFGTLGAIIGGRAKQKTNTTSSLFLIFTYKDNNEIKNISFSCTGNYKAYDFVNEFKNTNNTKTNEIQL